MKRNGLAICLCSLLSSLTLAAGMPAPIASTHTLTSSYVLPQTPTQKDFEGFLEEMQQVLSQMDQAGQGHPLYTRQILAEAERRYYADDVAGSWLGYLYAATHFKEPLTPKLAARFAFASQKVSPLAMELTAYVIASNPPIIKDPYSDKGQRIEALPFALLMDAIKAYDKAEPLDTNYDKAYYRLLDLYGIRQGSQYAGIASFLNYLDKDSFTKHRAIAEGAKQVLAFYPELDMKSDPKNATTQARVFLSDAASDIARNAPRRRACTKAEYALQIPNATEDDVITYMKLCFNTNPERAVEQLKGYLKAHQDAKKVPIILVQGLAVWAPEEATQSILDTIRHKKLGELHFEKLGDEAMRANSPAVALEAYERCRDDCVDPNLDRLTRKEAKAYQAAGMTDKAVELYKSLPLDLTNSLHVLQLYFEKERYPEALAYADEVIPQLPFDRADLEGSKGLIYLKQNRLKEASQAYTEALKTEKQNVAITANAFVTYAKLKDRKAGLALLKDATHIDDYWDKAGLVTSIGRWANAVGEEQTAKKYLNRAMVLAPLLSSTQLAWAEYALSHQEPEAAIRFARLSLSLDEQNNDALNLLNTIYQDKHIDPALTSAWESALAHSKTKKNQRDQETQAREARIQAEIHKYVDPLVAKTEALKKQTQLDKHRLAEANKKPQSTSKLRVTVTPIQDGTEAQTSHTPKKE